MQIAHNASPSPSKTIAFTKMQGAGNDVVVLNDFSSRLPPLSADDFRVLGDRRYGVGCDQILIVGQPANPANDFSYRIVNQDGSEVEHCGNGARCFMRYVREQGLTQNTQVRVEVATGVITLHEFENGEIEVDMGAPRFDPAVLPFSSQGLESKVLTNQHRLFSLPVCGECVTLGAVSMGNPHAVQVVANVDDAPVTTQGPLIENHVAFPNRVNAGFMQVLDAHRIKLRVWERGAGETLACGTGACAAVVAGIARGLLASPVEVQARGGVLNIRWDGTPTQAAPVLMRGPAVTVYHGTIAL